MFEDEDVEPATRGTGATDTLDAARPEQEHSTQNCDWTIPGVPQKNEPANGPENIAEGSCGKTTNDPILGELRDLIRGRNLDLATRVAMIGVLLEDLPTDIRDIAPDGLAGLGELVPVTDRLHTLTAQACALAEAGGMWALDGSRSFVAHATRNLPLSRRRTITYLANGQALRDHLPTARAALHAGALGWDAATTLVKFATKSERTIAALNHPVPLDAGTDKIGRILRKTATQHANAAADSEPTACTKPGPDAHAGVETETTTSDTAPDAADHQPETETASPEPEIETAGSDSDLPEGMVRCEDWLVARGIELTEREFRRLLDYWAAMVDPAAHEAAYKTSEADAYISAGQTLDCCHIQGKLAPEGGKTLLTALETFRPAHDKDHPRGFEERNAEALVTIARIALETNTAGDSATARPHIGLTISWETFRAMATHAGHPTDQLDAMATLPPAMWADTTSPIPPSLMATIACDADITRIVFGPGNQIINLGRTNRVITPGLRRAIIARDHHCIFPRCDAPPVLCQAHHLNRWSNGGKTDADNLALLCGHHHRWIHANGITIRPTNRTPGRSADADPPGTTVPNDRQHATRSTADPPQHTGPPPAEAPSGLAAAIAVQGTLLDTRPAYDFIDRHGRYIS